jgi:translation initiation factor 2B subunit (eIF-2B alpha/beta/delta family)
MPNCRSLEPARTEADSGGEWVAGETNTDRIRALEREVSPLGPQLGSLKLGIERMEEKLETTTRLAQDLDKRLALLADKVDRLEKGLEEIRIKRWEIGKIILTAVLSSALGLLIGRFLK